MLDKHQWYEENKERIKKQQKEYRERNKEKIKARQREYYAENKEKRKAYQREYQKNKAPEDRKEYMHNWYIEHKEYAQFYRSNQYRKHCGLAPLKWKGEKK